MTGERLVVSPYVASDSSDENGQIVVHALTGARFKLSREALEVLRAFQRPVPAEEVAAQFGIAAADASAWLEVLADLQAKHLLITDGTQELEEVNSVREALAVQILAPVQSFCDTPSVAVSAIPEGAVVVMGIPLDSGSTGHTGARLAPDHLRHISRRFVSYEADICTDTFKGVYSADTDGILLRGARIVDVGNVAVHLHEGADVTFDRCRDVARSIFSRARLALFLGGDHSISYPVIAAAREKYANLLVVHFDAHTDRATWLPGTVHHHGNAMARVLEELDVRVVQYGVRGFAGTPATHDRCRTVTNRHISTNFTEVIGSLPSGNDCYISVDVDVLDPAFAPATGTPVPFGMRPDVLLDLVEAVACRNRVRAIDVVEYSPPLDREDCTGTLIIHAIMRALDAGLRGSHDAVD